MPRRFRERASSLVMRVGPALGATAAGAWFALDTSERGWTTPAIVSVACAALAAVGALLGRVTRRPVLERAALVLAVTALVVGALGALVFHLRG